MILKQVISSLRHVSTSLRGYFGSQGHKDARPSGEDKVEITKFNPYGEKDLRGFEHLSKLNEN
jgi:hypothetical protein